MPAVRRTFLFFSTSESLVQGQLYQRILEHIHDPEVRRLAHPGLVLRRITPDLIKQVLQGPCDVPVPNDTRAQQLFDALRREVALVTMDIDGALRPRPDVRRIVLKLLERDKPQQAEAIHRLAVQYYSQQESLPARAEELYHRLQLCQPADEIEARWIQGVEEYLRDVINELPAESRPFLASYLGIRLPKEDVRAATIAEWERYTARRAD